jgi:hypothetical protein
MSKTGERKVNKRQKQRATELVHLTDGERHVVGLKALRVMLSHDESGWFAQGLEIDYAAAGKSMEEVKANFELGLALTMREHLKMHGGLEKLLQVAPQEAWQEFLDAPPDAVKASYSTVMATELFGRLRKSEKSDVQFPFDAIQFVNPEPVAA